MPLLKRKRAMYKKKSMKKRVSSVVRRRRLTKLIKRVVMKKTEPKCKRANFGKGEMYHNAFYSAVGPSGYVAKMNDSAIMPLQGAGDNQRIGDQINFTGYKLKILMGQKGDRPNVSFRWFVLKVPKGSSITYADWFIATTGNILLDDPNPDFVKTLASGLWRPNEAGLSATGNDEYTFAKRLWIPYKKVVKFGPADGATTHNDDDVYLVIMAYDAFGTAVTDNIAYAQVGIELHYRDP